MGEVGCFLKDLKTKFECGKRKYFDRESAPYPLQNMEGM